MALESTVRPFLAQPVPSSLRKSFEKLDAALWIAVSNWMKRHGKVLPSTPFLNSRRMMLVRTTWAAAGVMLLRRSSRPSCQMSKKGSSR